VNIGYLLVLIVGLVLCAQLGATATEVVAEAPQLPIVLAIGTGGTIAGVQQDPADPDLYRAGSLSAEQIVASVPELATYARIESLQFSNVASARITPTILISRPLVLR
jgi:L-asparaginase